MQKIRSEYLVIIGAILWGTTGAAQGFAPSNATPLVIGAIRMAIGGSLLILIAFLKGAFKEVKKLDYRRIILASLCMALYQPFFFTGVKETGIALGTVLALGSAPIFSGIIDFFVDQSINKKWILSTLLSISGCVILFSAKGRVGFDFIGMIFSLSAGLSYAIYVKITQCLFQYTRADLANGLIFFTAALMVSPLLFLSDLSWIFSKGGIIVSLHLGIVTTTIAYSIFAKGLKNIAASKAVTLTLAEPLTAALLGFIVFKEAITYNSLTGISMIFIGLLINTLPEKKMRYIN